MVASMTAYSYIEEDNEIGRITWECKSINHRHLEIGIQLPEQLRTLEAEVRQRLAARFKRGKVTCSLYFKASNSQDQTMSINMDLAKSLINSAQSIQATIGNAAMVNAMDILRWPGVIKHDVIDVISISEILMQQLDKALQCVVEMRLREGEKLRSILLERCQNIDSLINTFTEKLPAIQQILRDKLHQRSQELAIELNSERVEQEIFFLLQKSDVAEELDRLTVHSAEIKRVLAQDQPIGRRLDFMMQELNREANTLGSKAIDLDYTQLSIELKVQIEQMREQIQNIE